MEGGKIEKSNGKLASTEWRVSCIDPTVMFTDTLIANPKPFRRMQAIDVLYLDPASHIPQVVDRQIFYSDTSIRELLILDIT